MNPLSEGTQSPRLEDGLRRLSWRSGEEETYSWCAPPPFLLKQMITFGERKVAKMASLRLANELQKRIMDSSVAVAVAYHSWW